MHVHVVRATEVVTFTYVSTYVHTPIGSCDDEYCALLNGNRSGGLGSCLVKVPGLFYNYTKDHARLKMRPLYVNIMVCRPFSLAVGHLKKNKKEKMEKIVVWPISVYNSSDVF